LRYDAVAAHLTIAAVALGPLGTRLSAASCGFTSRGAALFGGTSLLQRHLVRRRLPLAATPRAAAVPIAATLCL